MSTQRIVDGNRVTCDAAGCLAHYEGDTFGREDGWVSVSPPGEEWALDYCDEHALLLDDDGHPQV